MEDLYNNHFGGAVGSKGEFRRNYLKVVTLAALSLLTQHPSPTFRAGLNTPKLCEASLVRPVPIHLWCENRKPFVE